MSRFLPGQLAYHRYQKVKVKVVKYFDSRFCQVIVVPDYKHETIFTVHEKSLYPISDFTPARYSFTTLMYILKAGALPPLKL